MIENEQIISLLNTLHEHTMAKDIFVPVLKKMQLKGVRFTGGQTEQGIDIEYYELTAPEKHKSYVGIQFKKGDLTYGAGGGKNTVKEIKNQAEEAFEKEIHDVEGKGVHFISRFIVATTGEINDAARTYIGRARLKGIDRRIDYWPGNMLVGFINQHWKAEFEAYFQSKINSTPTPLQNNQIVDDEYIEENYPDLVNHCRKVYSAVTGLEWTILKALAVKSGELTMGDLLFEIEENEESIRDVLSHLRAITYIDIDDELCVNLTGKASKLSTLYDNICEELAEAEEDISLSDKIFKAIVRR